MSLTPTARNSCMTIRSKPRNERRCRSVAPAEIAKVRDAGYSDAEIVEIIAHVALNTFTNYVNEALDTEIDFPRIDRAAA